MTEFSDYLFKMLVFILNIFIYIGDFVRWLIWTIIQLIIKAIYYFFVSIGFIASRTSWLIIRFFKKIHKVSKALILNISLIVKNIFSLTVSFPGKIFKKVKSFLLKIKKRNFNLNFTPVKVSKLSRAKSKKTVVVKIFPDYIQKVEYFFLGIFFTFVFIAIHQMYLFVVSLPSPNLIGSVNYPVSSQIYDRSGKLLYELYRDQNRTPVKLEDLPIYIRQATIAIEDKSFYSHNGVSLFDGVLRAVRETFTTKQVQGGSTITQQLVKSSLLTPERTIKRKIKEVILALWTERIFTKNQILEMYLNYIPYGGASYGIEEASKNYFGKSAKELSISEAAFLAGLPQAPTLYSPYVYPDLAKQRQNDVLKKMREQNFLTEEEYQLEIKKPLVVLPIKQSIKAPHFVFYVKSLLEEQYGLQQVEEGGLRIVTSLDLDLQEKNEQILKEEIDKIIGLNVTNGSILVTNPKNGDILSMVGSYDYFASPSGAFNATVALRQPGSSIKPLLYALALENNWTAASTIDNTPISYKSPWETYTPVNYDGKFHGRVTLRYALANSYNIPAVKLVNALGVSEFVSSANNMGLSTLTDPNRYGLSIALGGAEVKMTDMAVAFGSLANQGRRVDLDPIIKITDYKGNIIYEKKNKNTSFLNTNQVVSEDTAFIISDILSDSLARRQAFGPNSALEIPNQKVAVKTGTTNDKRDNWTIGYTPQLLTAVWVGNNNNLPMNQALTSGITGAAPIWNRVMNLLLNSEIKKEYLLENGNKFVVPEKIVKKTCYFGQVEYFIPGTESKVSCKEYLFNITPTVTPNP